MIRSTHPAFTAGRRGLLALAPVLWLAAAAPAFAAGKSVAVTAIVDHPSLDAVRDGMKEALRQAGFEDGKDFRFQFQSAQGNTSTAAQIARKYVGDAPDVIVPISTPSAQAVAVATKAIPIVYSAVGDPLAAGLVKGWGASGTNVTGVSDQVQPERQLAVIRQVLPQARRIGIIYSPGEANSVAFVTLLKKAVAGAGFTLVEAAAPRTVDVTTAAKSLVGKVDVLFAPTDNTLASAFAGVAKVADDAKLPLFAGASEMVEQGAAFGLGVNYTEIGRQTGRMVVRVLKGEAPGSLPSETSASLDVVVNAGAAKKQGVVLPEALLKTARVVGP